MIAKIRSTFPYLLLVSLMAVTFLLPIERERTPPFIVLSVFFALIGSSWKEKVNFWKANKKMTVLPLLWLIYALSMAYAPDLKYGWKNLETQLSMLVFPVVFTCLHPLVRVRWRWFVYSLIAGLMVTLLVDLNLFVQNSIVQDLFIQGKFDKLWAAGYGSLVFSKDLLNPDLMDKSYGFIYLTKHFQHTSYLSMYLVFSIVFLLSEVFSAKQMKSKIGLSLLLSIVTFFVLWLSSRAAYLSLIIVLPCVLLFVFRFNKISLVLSFVGIAVMITLVLLNPRIKQRIDNAVSLISEIDTKAKVDKRIILWKAAVSRIAENPIWGSGVGTSNHNAREVLGETHHKEKNYKYNSHNQYLDTTIDLGYIGLLLLLVVLLWPLVDAVRERNYMLFGFMILIIVNMLFESMFKRVDGIPFISLFMYYFWIQYPPNKKVKGQMTHVSDSN